VSDVCVCVCPQRDERAAELTAVLASQLPVSCDVSKYAKLLQLGQPVEHVKARMRADGVDPDLLQ